MSLGYSPPIVRGVSEIRFRVVGASWQEIEKSTETLGLRLGLQSLNFQGCLWLRSRHR